MGKSVEVGLAGKEGFIGLPLVVGLSTSPSRVVMQVAGSAFRIRASDFTQALRRCPQLERQLNRFTHAMAMQATQVAACNRVHEVEERLARWLLMSQDRLGGDHVPLTQEFLAHMLGTRRASVTVAAGILQKAGLIRYTRGEVNVVNRDRIRRRSLRMLPVDGAPIQKLGKGIESVECKDGAVRFSQCYSHQCPRPR